MKNNVYILLAFLLAACSSSKSSKDATQLDSIIVQTTQQIVGIGKITPENDIVPLSTAVGGIVYRKYKNENDLVEEGSLIVELEHSLEDAKIQQLHQEIKSQQAQIAVENAKVEDWLARTNNASVYLQRLTNLLALGAETKQTVDNAKTELQSLQSNLKSSQAGVEVAKSRLLETQAALEVAQVQRRQKNISSPVNGRILELDVTIGSSVQAQQSIGQLNPLGTTIAICEIDELYSDRVVVGQKTWIRHVGSTDTISTGKVIFTSSFLKKKSLFTDQSGEKEDRRVRTIKMSLDKSKGLLLNARVECVIDLISTPQTKP
jgi:multidrug efflux pump subunit AcrA (membrane-fusion protein)